MHRRHVLVSGLAVIGTLLLAVSMVVELADADLHAELWAGTAAGVIFLLTVGLNQGAEARVLARRARLLAGAGLSALLAVAALWQATGHTAPRVLLLLVPVGLLFTTAGLGLREADVRHRRARLRELRAHLDGQESERRRWVRELHDETLQELAAVHLLLGVAAASHELDPQTKAIADARNVVDRQIQTLRRLISRMRPLALDTLGLAAALDDLARTSADITGIDIDLYGDELPRLAADAETHIYRIAQEALTNAVRHSGATRITIEARGHPQRLELTVRDNGRGHPAGGRFTPGFGLTGMRERAEALGGRLTITGSDVGTLVRLQVPLSSVAAAQAAPAGQLPESADRPSGTML